jgi:hypothetical protein
MINISSTPRTQRDTEGHRGTVLLCYLAQGAQGDGSFVLFVRTSLHMAKPFNTGQHKRTVRLCDFHSVNPFVFLPDSLFYLYMCQQYLFFCHYKRKFYCWFNFVKNKSRSLLNLSYYFACS